MEVATPLLVLAALLGVYALIFGGLRRRPGRPGKAPFVRYRAVGAEGGAGMVVLTTVAAVQLMGVSSPLLAAILALGLGLGMSLAIKSRSERGVSVAADTLGVLAALAATLRFIATSNNDSFERGFRVLVMGMVIGVFALTALLLGRWRFLGGHRGLALFALVDITTFLASPGGVDLLGLSTGRAQLVVLLAVALAVLLGIGASEYLLTATAALVVGIAAITSITGLSSVGGAAAIVVGGAVSGLIALKVVGP